MQNIEGGNMVLVRAQGVLPEESRRSATLFALGLMGFGLLSALLISWKPLQLSIITVLVFAGPHNWMEFRYFLARMPARWGRARLFYTVGLGGVALLTVSYISLYALGQSWYLNPTALTLGVSLWNTALVMWVCWLLHLHGRERRGRDWSWAFAPGFALCAGAWSAPFLFSLGLVYLHPLVALLFLDRQLKRSRPGWRKSYHLCLAGLACVLVLMCTGLARSQNLSDETGLFWRITQHAGAGLLTGISSHLLVAMHVFLETIHYSVWLMLIPLLGIGGALTGTSRIPLATHRERGWPAVVRAVLLLGLLAVVALWAGFTFDYTRTRDIYFALAVAHVLAEAPFLIRLL
jgi:hypothetical protein